MKNPNPAPTTRRQFLTKIAPACALTCMGGKQLLGMMQTNTEEGNKHKFDQPTDFSLTYRQYYRAAARKELELIKTLIKELGERKAIKLIETNTRENALALGRRQAEAAEKNDLYTYVDIFRDTERYKNTLTMEIVEDTEKAFELKITECLYAVPYLEAGLGGKVGFAAL